MLARQKYGHQTRNPMKALRIVYGILRGWLHLLAFITGGNFVRLACVRHLGRGAVVSPTVFLKHPENITIGDRTFINHLCCIWAAPNGTISIGADVLFGPSVSVIASNHGTALRARIAKQPWKDAPIEIGDDVWLGANVVVTAGVSIGAGCVVGAGAVVTRDLPPNSICVGVPARPIATRQ